jgi:hypothetical protein
MTHEEETENFLGTEECEVCWCDPCCCDPDFADREDRCGICGLIDMECACDAD